MPLYYKLCFQLSLNTEEDFFGCNIMSCSFCFFVHTSLSNKFQQTCFSPKSSNYWLLFFCSKYCNDPSKTLSHHVSIVWYSNRYILGRECKPKRNLAIYSSASNTFVLYNIAKSFYFHVELYNCTRCVVPQTTLSLNL